MLPFSLGIDLSVFTKLTKVVATTYAEHGITALFYVDAWLIVGTSPEQTQDSVTNVLALTEGIDFAFNIPKSSLIPV